MRKRKKHRLLEDWSRNTLSGEAQKNALDFIAFMRANDLPPDPKDYNWFKYLGENICVLMHDDGWSIYWADCDIYSSDDSQVDEGLKEFALSHINPCARHEKAKCNPGKRKTIFGKLSSENLCTSTLCFDNPSAEELEQIKILALMRKQNIAQLKNADRGGNNNVQEKKAACH